MTTFFALTVEAERVKEDPAPAGPPGLSAVSEGLEEAKAQEAEQQDEQQEEEETGDSPPLSREQFLAALAALRSADSELSCHIHQDSDSVPEFQRDLRWPSLADQRDFALEIASDCADLQFGRKDPEFMRGP